MEKLGCRSQIEERLVAERRETTFVTHEQDASILVEVDKKLVRFPVVRLKTSQQVHLQLNEAWFTATEIFPLLSLLDVLDVETDALAQVKDRLCDVCRNVVDNDAADHDVASWCKDQVWHPKSEHCDKQVLTRYLHFLYGLVPIEDSVLVSAALDVIHLLQVTHYKENFLEWVTFALVLIKDAIGALRIKLAIINLIRLVRYCELTFF